MADRPEIDPYFRDAFEGRRAAALHLVAASESIKAGGDALVRTADAMLHARVEHEDLKKTIARLERLVLKQGTELGGEIRRLGDEVRHLRDGEGSGKWGPEA